MSMLNVMKASDTKKVSKIHVDTRSYENPGGMIQLLLSKDFLTLTISIKGKESTIRLSKATAKELETILGEGII